MKPNFHIWYFYVILYFETRWLSWATSFLSKSRGKLFYRQEKSEILYIFVPKHVRCLDPSENGWWRRWLCMSTCALWVSIQIQCQIANFLRAILWNGAIHTSTTAAQSMEGTASFFSHLLDLNKEVSSVSFKFKSARYSKHADSKPCFKEKCSEIPSVFELLLQVTFGGTQNLIPGKFTTQNFVYLHTRPLVMRGNV